MTTAGTYLAFVSPLFLGAFGFGLAMYLLVHQTRTLSKLERQMYDQTNRLRALNQRQEHLVLAVSLLAPAEKQPAPEPEPEGPEWPVLYPDPLPSHTPHIRTWANFHNLSIDERAWLGIMRPKRVPGERLHIPVTIEYGSHCCYCGNPWPCAESSELRLIQEAHRVHADG